jgi:transcription antitermination factor NusG
MTSTRKWYVVYTKPRWEKKVNQLLTDQKLDSYCPLNKVRRKWSDRHKVVEEPLFKSYVFVRSAEDELTKVRMVNGVLNLVYWNGKPAVVRDQEILDIMRFMNEFQDVQAIPMEIKPHSKVVIQRGVMMNKEAEVLRVKSKFVEVLIESLGYKLVASIDKSNLIPVE